MEHGSSAPGVFPFEVLVVSLGGTWDPSLPIAASRAGALGLLDLTYLTAIEKAVESTRRLRRLSRGRFGLVLHGRLGPVEEAALDQVGPCDTILLTYEPHADLAPVVDRCRRLDCRLGLVVTSPNQAEQAAALGMDLIVAKGYEAGGLVGEETSFILTQRFLGRGRLPVFVWGGIGRHTAAACCLAGAAGVMIDWQLSLTRESPLWPLVQRRIAEMDGSQSVAIAGPSDQRFRCFEGPGFHAAEQLRQASRRAASEGLEEPGAWRDAIENLLLPVRPRVRLWPIGQDAAFAASWARRGPTVARCLSIIRDAIDEATSQDSQVEVLAPHNPLAKSHGIKYPIAQAPMTRVTDSPEFAHSVAEAGGLPFLSLSTMDAEQVRTILSRTGDLLEDRPWGVAVHSVVDRRLREEQLHVLRETHPPVVLLGAGTAAEAASLEGCGTQAYLYVASPAMLQAFLSQGARRFVFEGCECGGYVGSRSGFVLWETMIETLLAAPLTPAEAEEIHVLLAGGIHDRRSSLMISTITRPLVERSMKVGVLVATAYLFTEEIVETGAVVPSFQQQALRTDRTVRLELSEGKAVRCAETPFCETFGEARQQHDQDRVDQDRAEAAPRPGEHEQLCLDRIRTATRGVARLTNPTDGESPFVAVDDRQQHREGLYVLGQAASLRHERWTVRQLHEQLSPSSPPADDPRPLSLVKVESPPPVPPPLDIAIVGMACLLPGADDLGTYWENILDQKDAIEEVPRDRFHVEQWYDPDQRARDKIASKWGGFLHDLAFDPLKYGIPPKSLKSIEPMQLLALKLVDQVLDDAGYGEQNPHKDRTCVIFGAGGGSAELGANYAFRAMLPQYVENPDESLWRQLPEWTEDSFAGILLNVVSGRISNRFDLGSVNFTVDAACASSLAAVYLACRELADGTADMAVTGGCDTVQNPISYLCFGKSGALSPTGRSRPFDESADGITISEGLAAVVLKRREDAERDGDRIYCLIRAMGGGSDGRSKGLTAPRPEGQIRTFERAYAQARFSPATVALFEAHGTGTAVGDATECGSLTDVLTRAGAVSRSCAIGSVKSMIGHAKCTAGVAGLIKSALALHHRVLPPTMHVNRPNAKAGLSGGPLYPNTETRPWVRGVNPRRAGVSAFGFGGTNFHAVLEEYLDDPLSPAAVAPRRKRVAEPFFFEAPSAIVLRTRITALADPLRRALEADTEIDFSNLAFTWHRRFEPEGAACRAAIVATNPADLLAKLDELATAVSDNHEAAKLSEGVHYTREPLARNTPLAVLFPGQGSQYVNMQRELAIEFHEVSAAFETADAALRESLGGTLSRHVYPPPAFDEESRRRAADHLKSTDVLQPALGASSVGLWRLLESFGLEAGMVAGHSYGELVALYAAGCIEEAELYRISWARGKAIVDMAESGGDGDLGRMIAVRAAEASVKDALSGCREVWLANLNSPRQTIISGTRDGIAEAQRRLDEARLAHTPLAVSCAFHSPLMKPAGRRFEQVLANTTFVAPRLPVYSNRTGSVYASDARAIRHELTEHLVDQVRFAAEIEAMYAAGARVFVEVGPGRVLSRLVDNILGDRPHRAVATSIRQRHDVLQLADGLAELFVQGSDVVGCRWFAGRSLKELDLATMRATDDKPLAKHVWLVNGAYARPLGQPRRDPTPKARLASDREASVPPPVSPRTSIPAVRQPSAKATSASAKATATSTASSKTTSSPKTISVGRHQDEAVDSRPFVSAAPEGLRPVEPKADVAPLPSDRPPSAMTTDRTDSTNVPRLSEGQAVGGRSPEVSETVDIHLEARNPRSPMPERENHKAVPPLPAAHARSAADADVFAMFQETMRRFLDVQETAVAAFFAGQAASEAASPPIKSQSVSPTEIRSSHPRPPAAAPVSPHVAQPSPSVAVEPDLPASQPHFDASPAIPPAMPDTAEPVREPVAPVVESPAARAPAVPVSAPVAEQVSPAATVDVAELGSQLVSLVSERTGYPSDMLDLDANLEADLGIDSIKRVEIIGVFRRAVLPDLEEPPESFMEQMAAATTLREILDGVSSFAGDAEAAEPSVPSQPEAPPSGVQVPAAEVEIAAENVAATNVRPDDLRESLVGIVSERTGYPPDMLDLDANLEADLGIDSIKRVEVIGAFRRTALPHCEEPPEWFMDEMTAAGTLRAILDGVEKLTAENGHSSQSPSSSEPVMEGRPANPKLAPNEREQIADSAPNNGKPVDCPRCTTTAVEAPLDARAATELPEGVFVLTDDRQGVARRVASSLQTLGRHAVVLDSAALENEAAARKAIEPVRAAHGAIGVLLHLLPLGDAPHFPDIPHDEFLGRFNHEVRGLLFLLKALRPELDAADDDNLWIASVSIGGGDFLHSPSEVLQPWRGGLAGLLKTAAKEWPGARFRAIDVDERPEASLLLAELSATGDEVEVGYRRSRRLVMRPLRQELSSTDSPLLLSEQDVVLVTGGARGVTAEIAHELATRTRAKFILLGRTPAPIAEEDPAIAALKNLSEISRFVAEKHRAAGTKVSPKQLRTEAKLLLAQREIRQTLALLQSAGSPVQYCACDVRDEAGLADVLRETKRQFGPVTAIIHGAGVIEDHNISDKTAASFDRVVGTKLQPLLNLLPRLDLDRLRAMVLFSSVAGFFGNAGQSDYAAANETLNRIAARLGRLRSQTRIVAINWGPWEGKGMVTPEVARQFATRGVGMVRPLDGRRAAIGELQQAAAGDHVIIYGPGPWVDEADRLAISHPPTTEKPTAEKPAATKSASGKSAGTHWPLLAELKVRHADEGTLEAEMVLDVKSHEFLQDHCIDDKPVLPAAVAMELIAETAAAAAPGFHVVRIENLRLFRGVVIEHGSRAIRLHAQRVEPTDEGGLWRVRISDAEHPRRPYYEAVARMARRKPSPPVAPSLPRIDDASPVTAQQAYDEWLFHGPMFHTIKQLRGVDPTGIDAVVSTACKPTEGNGSVGERWLIDPTVLDAAPQMALLWSRAMYGTSMLPNRIGVYERYGAIGEGTVELIVRVDPETDRSTFRGDAWFLRNGKVVGFLGGLECAGSAALNRIGGTYSK